MPSPLWLLGLLTCSAVPWCLSMQSGSWSLTSGIDVQAVAAGESLRAAIWRRRPFMARTARLLWGRAGSDAAASSSTCGDGDASSSS